MVKQTYLIKHNMIEAAVNINVWGFNIGEKNLACKQPG